MIFIGVDIGTTRTKALVHDAETGERRIFAAGTPVRASSDGDLRDADEVLQTVIAVVGEALTSLSRADRLRLTGIGVTSLSEEMVLVRSDGSSVGPMPAWYNTAGAGAAVSAGIDPSFSWAKLRWAHERIVATSAPFSEVSPADVATVTTLNGYIADRLCLAGRFAVDHSHASRTGFFDVADGVWRHDSFTESGWASALLPELVPTASEVGRLCAALAEEWGVPAVPVALAGHDHFCGAYGIGVRGRGQLYVSAGTSEAHCLIMEQPPEGDLPAGVSIGRFVDGERFYLHRQLPSGHLYQHWRGLLSLEDVTAEHEARLLAARPIGSGGALLVPGYDTDTSTRLLTVGATSDAVSLMRALLEGLACAARHVDLGLAEAAGLSVDSVLAAGIPTRSPVWREMRASLSPAPLWVSDEPEAAALGAALLAQLALTGTSPDPLAFRSTEVSPARRTAYLELYERYLAVQARIA